MKKFNFSSVLLPSQITELLNISKTEKNEYERRRRVRAYMIGIRPQLKRNGVVSEWAAYAWEYAFEKEKQKS